MKKNQRKQNKLCGIKEDLQRFLFGQVGRVYNGDLWDVSQGGAFLVKQM